MLAPGVSSGPGRWWGLVQPRMPKPCGAWWHMVQFAVAGAFGVRPREVSLVAGERSRTKVLEVGVDADQGRRTLEALLAR